MMSLIPTTNYRKYRMSHLSRYDHITTTATEPKTSWTNAEVAQFHYFNPNGLIQAKRALDDQISDLVYAGAVPSGWLFSYGSMASFQADRIRELAIQDRVGSITLSVAIEMLTEQNEKVAAKIDEALAARELGLRL